MKPKKHTIIKGEFHSMVDSKDLDFLKIHMNRQVAMDFGVITPEIYGLKIPEDHNAIILILRKPATDEQIKTLKDRLLKETDLSNNQFIVLDQNINKQKEDLINFVNRDKNATSLKPGKIDAVWSGAAAKNEIVIHGYINEQIVAKAIKFTDNIIG